MKDKNAQQQATLIPTLSLFQLYGKTGKIEMVLFQAWTMPVMEKNKRVFEKMNAEELKKNFNN